MKKDLSHRTVIDDASKAGVASGDYLIFFRKDGKNPIPIEHPNGFDYYAGACPMPADILAYKNFAGDQKQNRFSHWIWRRYASCIWDDIRVERVVPFRDCKDPEDEKHVHALQLDIIERAIQLRTNPGENVFTPFMGVGSEVLSAVRLGRRGIGTELKTSYFRQAVKNMGWEEPAKDEPDDMFAGMEDDELELME
jgi:DNA modification methylase